MKHINPAMVHRLDHAFATRSELFDLLVEPTERALRLSESHYLVQWQVNTPTWCVIDMTALDAHAGSCPMFRYHQYCEHLGLIGELCAREAETYGRWRH